MSATARCELMSERNLYPQKSASPREERVAFPFEVKILRAARRLRSRALPSSARNAALRRRVPRWRKLLGINFFPIVSPALAVKTMSGSFGCGGIELDLAVETGKRVDAALSIALWSTSAIRAARATHPWIDLVLDAVMIRRTKKQVPHVIPVFQFAGFGCTGTACASGILVTSAP